MTTYEQRLMADVRQSIEAALRMLDAQTLFNVRAQATQAASWTSELVGVSTIRRMKEKDNDASRRNRPAGA